MPNPPTSPAGKPAPSPRKGAIRVLIVDDIPCVRRAVRSLLEDEPGFQVVGEASEGSEALLQVASCRPDVVLMDIKMPGMDGLAAIRRLQLLSRPPKVLVMTEYEGEQYIASAIDAGADEFLPKRLLTERLLASVRSVAASARPLSVH